MSDDFRKQILDAVHGKKVQEERQIAQTKQNNEKKKAHFEEFKTAVTNVIVPAFEELVSILEEAGANPEIELDLREDGNCPEVNYNSVHLTFKPNQAGNSAPYLKLKISVQRNPDSEKIHLKSDVRNPNYLNTLADPSYHITELSREVLMRFATGKITEALK